VHTSPERKRSDRHRRSGRRAASVAEAKHCLVHRLTAGGNAVRSASHVGDTRVRRCGFGRAPGLGDRRSGRHLPPRQGTALWVPELRLEGAWGTTRRLNSRKVRWSEWIPQSTPFPRIGDDGGFMVVSSCRAAHRAASVATTACRKSEGGGSALVLRGPLRTSCAEGFIETTGAGDAATGSRERSSTGPIAPLPEWVHGPGQTRVDRDTMAGVVRSSDRAIDGWHGRSGARPNTSTQLGRFRVSARMRAGWLLASASIAGRDTAVPGKHRDAPTCTG